MRFLPSHYQPATHCKMAARMRSSPQPPPTPAIRRRSSVQGCHCRSSDGQLRRNHMATRLGVRGTTILPAPSLAAALLRVSSRYLTKSFDAALRASSVRRAPHSQRRGPIMKSSARVVLYTLAMSSLCAMLSTARGEGWVSIGPFGLEIPNHDVINGQVNALAIDPRDTNIIYIGAAEGGVWKTRDGGGSWIPLTDTQLVRTQWTGLAKATMSIGSLAIDPGKPQTIYAGTGDPNVACCFFGAGLGVSGSSAAVARGRRPVPKDSRSAA